MQQAPYELIGGESGVRQLVDRFYDEMDTLDEAAKLRAIHAPDLSHAREKLFKFLSGWMGGPQLYTQEYGHPRLRMRHMPFSIGIEERDQWLMCMNKAMDAQGITGPVRFHLEQAFFRTADFMRNREESCGDPGAD